MKELDIKDCFPISPYPGEDMTNLDEFGYEPVDCTWDSINKQWTVNRNKTIGITGCGGFIGNVVVRHLLKRGYKVKGIDNFFKGHCDGLLGVIEHTNFSFAKGDICNPKDCEKLIDGCDAIISLAAIVGLPSCDQNPALARCVNVDGVRNMVEARNKINKDIPLILTSTGSVYGEVEGICTEESPINTNTIYGLTKREGEKILTQEENTVIYRYATAFGLSPNMRVNLLVNDFVHRALTDRIINIFQGDFRRTFIHVADFANSLEFAINNYLKMQEQKIYNVGDDKLNWTKRELAEYIKSKTNCHLHFAETGVDADCRNYACSFKKLNDLGFTCKVGMEEGIDELIKATPILRMRSPYA